MPRGSEGAPTDNRMGVLHVVPCRPTAAAATIHVEAHPGEDCARICANKVVAGVRYSKLLPIIRSQKTRQFTSAQQVDQLEGLAVATP